MFFFVMALGAAVSASITLRGAAAQIEMNERQKADTPGGLEQHPPGGSKAQEPPVGSRKHKQRGDAAKLKPNPDNWTR